ncbi:glycosyltransferase family 2 protein [Urbifossiella limnaea]|uniref:Putative glycosyl transferase n=1 Tax=Urbifossiella limnaea TaxID=2528023 RepID=A0A517XVQ9_9BACT|nr:glycosyltransferase family 2 protein [Urbifossiella limnaea]QDU21605.1 putative glycosyl transferase [Urbifossiella limnaea]
MNEPLVTVLVVNFNGRRHLPACLAALAEQTLPRHRFEVVVVDNASRDDSVAWLRREHPWVRVVARPDNAGFAGGNNAGLPFARGRYLVLLNNDTIPDPHWLSELVSSAHSGGCAASKLVFAHDPTLVNSAGLDLLRDGRGADRGFRQRDCGQFEQGGPVFAGCGAAVLFDTHALDGPLFDPRYFVYYEDLDTFWRGQLAGRPTVYAPRSLVRHVHGGSAGEESPLFRYHVERNRTLTSLRNGDLFLAATAAFGLALRSARSLARWLAGRERRQMALATLRAFAAFLLLAPAVLAERAATRAGV